MPTLHDFTISDAAHKQLCHLLKNKPEGTFMRISVLGGGCSGFEYKFDFDTLRTSDDKDFFSSHHHDNHTCVVIDAISLPYLKGSVLDFTDTLGKTKFHIINPQATGSCGCGNSFSL